MAKKKASKAKSVVKIDGPWIMVDHGIYTETYLNGNAGSEELAEAEEQIRDSAKRRAPKLSALQQVHALQQRMRTAISMAIIPESAGLNGRWATVTADLGDGLKTHLCYAERIAAVDEAASALTMLDALIADTPSERESQIFLRGLTVGRLVEVMQVLPLEPFVAVGRKVQAGGVKGQKTTNADHVELHPKYQAEIDLLMKEGEAGGLTYTKAKEVVRKKFGVGLTTVENHTVNKWHSKGGRPKKATQPTPG